MKRLISALLVVGLIVTSLPVFAVSAFAGTDGTGTVGTTSNIEESGGAGSEEGGGEGEGTDLSDGAEELEVLGDERDGAPSLKTVENTSGKKGDLDSVEWGCGSPVIYTEETLTVPAQYVLYSNDEYAYIIFKDEGEETSLSQLMALDNIQSVELQFSLEDKINEEKFDVYPIVVPIQVQGTTSEIDWSKNYQSGNTFSKQFKTREILGEAHALDEDGYSIDVTKDILFVKRGLSAIIAQKGYYGYALTANGNVWKLVHDGEAKPKLIVTYQKETERTPNEDDIKAADTMLEQRQMTQGTLEGSGTVEDPYLIYDADDLQGMAENDNACYKLMCDIDLEGKNWRPPGYYYWYPFMGYLDGNGHTIKNLHVGGTGDDAWNTNAGGLFGYFEGRVENLHVETVQAERKGVDFFGYAGGIAGVANAPAEIVNCSFNGYVSGNGAIGGLVGVAYPGVIIENCAALGTVDMSDSFAYMRDNGMINTKEIIDGGYEILVYIVKIFTTSWEVKAKQAEGQSSTRAWIDVIWDRIKDLPIDTLMNTDTMKAMRTSYIGGLVGLNYGWIRNCYSSTEIHNLQNYTTGMIDWFEGLFGSTTGEVTEVGDWAAYNKISRLGGLVGMEIEGYSVIENSYFNADKGQGGSRGGSATTAQLMDPTLFDNETGKPENTSIMHNTAAETQWDYSMIKKSTGGLPLPKCNPVNRNLENENCVYYNSRVLMKTRPDFIIGEPVVKVSSDNENEYVEIDGTWYSIKNGVATEEIKETDSIIENLENGEETGAIYCTKCHELYNRLLDTASDELALENQIAVTGMYQRGSDARPYHVHDIDSLLAMQDSKESHFILCSDIDFKISKSLETTADGSYQSIDPIQKYWWPAGKSHTSPIKGSLKGNVANYKDIVNDSDTLDERFCIYENENDVIFPRTVNEISERFTIKNLTVQSNRHVGLFACFRGTFSDVNIELASNDNANDTLSYKDGIKTDWNESDNKVIAGLFTIGDKASAGAVAGETVNGAVIRNCLVTGPNLDNNPPKKGIIKGAIRTGGIVGMNNRGCTVENCQSLVYTDAENYETVYLEDTFGTGLEIYKAVIGQIDTTKNNVQNIINAFKEAKDPNAQKTLLQNIKDFGSGFEGGISSVINGPVAQYFAKRYGNVCIGGLIGENSGTVKNCIAYSESIISAGMPFSGAAIGPNHSATVGRSNAFDSNEDVREMSFDDGNNPYKYNENNRGAMNMGVSDESDFAGGDGTADSPYKIETIEQLARVRNYLKSGFHFQLQKDLSFAGYEENWVAIGTDADYFAFQGVFDGNGYTISGLEMDSSASAGLFGYCAGTIKNLKVKDFDIDTTASSAGAIVAELCAGGRVEQCAVENSTVNSAHYSGGIAGAAQKGSAIRNVYADGVSCSLSYIMTGNIAEDIGLGGLSGDGISFNNFGEIWNSVWGFLDGAGSLLGIKSFSDGLGFAKNILQNLKEGGSNIRTAAAGGIVGFLGGELSNSWVDRRTNVSDGISGIVGGALTAYQGDLVGRDFYGKITGEHYVLESAADSNDGIRPVGSLYAPGKYDYVIHTLEAIRKTTKRNVIENREVKEKEIEQLRFKAGTYIDDNLTDQNSSGLPCDKWYYKSYYNEEDDLVEFDYKLKALRADNPNAGNYLKASKLDKEIIAQVPMIDEADGFYMITNVNELAYIEYEGWSDYKLMNDIDLTGYNWAPLCREHDQYFDGTFDGQGYTIYGLNVETNENGGLFGYILGDVKNLNLGVEKVDAYGSAGGLAAGVYYPGSVSKVAVVDNDIAIAMAGERLFNEAFEKELDKEYVHVTSYNDLSSLENFRDSLSQNDREILYASANFLVEAHDPEKDEEIFDTFRDKYDYYHSDEFIILGGEKGGKNLQNEKNNFILSVKASALETLVKDMDQTEHPANTDHLEKARIDAERGVFRKLLKKNGVLKIEFVDWNTITNNISNAETFETKLTELHSNMVKMDDGIEVINNNELHIVGGGNSDGAGVGGLAGIVGKDVVIDNCYARVNVSNANFVLAKEMDTMGYILGLLNDLVAMIGDAAGHGEKIYDNNKKIDDEINKINDEYKKKITEATNQYMKDVEQAEKDLKERAKSIEEEYEKKLIDLRKKLDIFLEEKSIEDKKLRESSDKILNNFNSAKGKLEKKCNSRLDEIVGEFKTNTNTAEENYSKQITQAYNTYYAALHEGITNPSENVPESLTSSEQEAWEKVRNDMKLYDESIKKIKEELKSETDPEKIKSLKEQYDTHVKSYEEASNKFADLDPDIKRAKSTLDVKIEDAEQKRSESLNTAINNYIQSYDDAILDTDNEVTKLWEETTKEINNNDASLINIENEIENEMNGAIDEYDRINNEMNEAIIDERESNMGDADGKFGQSKEAAEQELEQSETVNTRVNLTAIEAAYLALDIIKGLSDVFYNLESDFYNSATGGLVGESRGKLVNCYTIGTVDTGFVNNFDHGFWGAADLFDVAHEGRLVGRVRNGDGGTGTGQLSSVQQQVVNCYYYGGYNVKGENNDVESHSEGLGNPCKTIKYWENGYNPMKNPSTFSGFDFSKTWKPGAYGGYPELIYPDDPYLDDDLAAGFTRDLFYGEGSGTKEDPYIIKTESQFLQIAQMRQMDYYYRLEADLDLTLKRNAIEENIFFGGVNYGGYNGAGWYDQYKESTDPTKEGDAFAGHFDGNGHKIIFCNKVKDKIKVKEKEVKYDEGYYAGGLFPMISGSVKNLEVVCKDDGHSKARYNGVLAGRLLSGGVVENVSVTYDQGENAKLEGRLAQGGLIGYADDNTEITNCAFYVVKKEKEEQRDDGTIEKKIIGIPFVENSNTKQGTLVGELKGSMEYVCGIVPSINTVNSIGVAEGTTRCVYLYDNNTDVPKEKDLQGLDFNHTWTIDAATNKPVLRVLKSTQMINYRAELNAACTEVNARDGSYGNANIEGSGTASDPFLVNHQKDIEALSIVMSRGYTFSGIYFQQTSDITSEGIVDSNITFGGNYNGGGYRFTIKIGGRTDLRKHLNGAVFRNCLFQLDSGMKEQAVIDEATNSMFLNCAFLNGHIDNKNIVQQARGVSVLNCLIEDNIQFAQPNAASEFNANAAAIYELARDPNFGQLSEEEIAAKEREMAVVFMQANDDSIFNGSIVGLDDADKSVWINNQIYADGEDNMTTYEELAKMTGVPENLKPWITPWEQKDGMWTMQQQTQIVNFDLGEGIQIEKVVRLNYTGTEGNEKLESVSPLDESMYVRDNTGIIGVMAPEGSVLKIDFSYNGETATDEDYVVVTHDLAQTTPNLRELISKVTDTEDITTLSKDAYINIANYVGTLPADSEDFVYQVEDEPTISLYKKGVAKRAAIITDKEYQGAIIEKIRLHYTDRIFDEVGAAYADISGFDSYSTSPQKVTVTYKGKTYEALIDLLPAASWSTATTMDIAKLPDKLFYNRDEKIDLSGMEITLNKGKPDEITRPIEELFKLRENENKTTQKVVQYEEARGEKYTINHEIALRTPFSFAQDGKHAVIIEILGYQVRFDVYVGKRAVESIEVTREPEQTAVTDENKLTLAGGELKVNYADDVIEFINLEEAEYTISNEIDDKGEKTVTISYMGCTDTFKVKAIDKKELVSITTSSLGKTHYVEGESFDQSGFTFRMHYNDGTCTPMSIGQILNDGGRMECNMNPLGEKSEEEGEVFIQYGGKTIKIDITISKSTCTILSSTYDVQKMATASGGAKTQQNQQMTVFNENKDSGAGTRYGYATFDIEQLKSDLEEKGLSIKKATLKYSAGSQSDDASSYVYVREAEEKTWINWSNKPVVYDILGVNALFDDTMRDIEMDVTAYIKEKLNGDTVTFGFTLGEVGGGTALIAAGQDGPELVIKIGEVENQPQSLEPTQAFFVQKGNGTVAKQAPDAAGRMMIKNNGSTGSNTRQGYITYDLSDIKSQLAEEGLEIDTAVLRYNASVNKEGYSRTLYVSGVNQEKSTWSNWNDKPGISNDGLLGTSLLTGTDVKETETDVTEYVKNRVGGDGNMVTFGFTASECGGEMIYLMADGEEAPELIIYTKEKRDVDSIEILQAPKVIYARNQALNLSGGMMKVEYADGTVDVISTGINEVIATGFSSAAAGIKEVTLTYRQKSDTYNVTIK